TRALLGSDRFVTTLTEKLLTYALGRGLDYHDAPTVRAIVRDAARNDYRFTSLILGIVQSAPFQMRMTQPAGAGLAQASGSGLRAPGLDDSAPRVGPAR